MGESVLRVNVACMVGRCTGGRPSQRGRVAVIHFQPSHWQLKERIEGLVARHIAPLAEEVENREQFPEPFFRVLAQEGFFRLALLEAGKRIRRY